MKNVKKKWIWIKSSHWSFSSAVTVYWHNSTVIHLFLLISKMCIYSNTKARDACACSPFSSCVSSFPVSLRPFQSLCFSFITKPTYKFSACREALTFIWSCLLWGHLTDESLVFPSAFCPLALLQLQKPAKQEVSFYFIQGKLCEWWPSTLLEINQNSGIK